jgi:hypothetical protein
VISSDSFFIRVAAVVLFGSLLFAGCALREGSLNSGSPLLKGKPRVAVMPVENLSATPAPLEEIRHTLEKGLENQGFPLLGDAVLDEFMARHRVRYTGGIDGATGKALAEEEHVGLVLITSLELYDELYPPKVAIISRLVSTGDHPVILWIDSAGLAGDQAPGILDLGLIEDPQELLHKALTSLTRSLARAVAGEPSFMGSESSQGGKFQPKLYFRSPVIDPEGTYSVVILPFFNRSDRRNAGQIMMLHFIKAFSRHENVRVVEPGVVRRELLNYRIVMEEGISLSDAALILSSLHADLAVTGKVLDYQDVKGTYGSPVVDFSSFVVERKSREVAWASKSYNKGSDNVFFFDWGRVYTAEAMASEMVRIVGDMMVK